MPQAADRLQLQAQCWGLALTCSAVRELPSFPTVPVIALPLGPRTSLASLTSRLVF